MPDHFSLNALTFRVLRLLGAGGFVSGADLARTLGVSRTSVWKALQGVEQAGVDLIRQHARGYRLAAPIDWLGSEAISQHIGVHRELYEVRIADMVESTNTTLLAEATAGAPSGRVLAAELQTRGRGRRGRDWHSGLGGALTFSVLWRFDQGAGYLAGLGPAVGVALVRGLRALGVQEIALKWPNDVLIRHQKVAGTLVEIQGDVLGPSAAVVGVGVNFRLHEATRQRIDQAVIDLVAGGAPADRNRVLGKLLAQLADVLQIFSMHGFGALRKEWEGMHVYSGRPVSVRLPGGGQQDGTVAGVGDDGALLLQTTSGLRRFHSGEVSLRAAAAPGRPRWTSNG